MNNLKELECPISPNCKNLKPDGNCNCACFPKIAQRAQICDQRDSYFGSADTISRLQSDSDNSGDRIH